MPSGDRVAVVLFNLGGPDSPAAIQPFLFNLFSDPAIIGAPGPIRWMIATLIARRRTPVAKAIYEKMGGRSPLPEITERQGQALEAALARHGVEARTFVAMRYWYPRAAEAVKAMVTWGANRAVLLPLYPQYSSTTTGSSVGEWRACVADAGVTVPTETIRSYPQQRGLVAAQCALIREALERVTFAPQGIRVLFSAHGLPKKIVAKGDPYQREVEQTTAAIVAALGMPGLDWVLSYQSRVGPMEWIGPATDEEIRRAGGQGKAVVVVPVAFVSDHSETLVELDIEYAHLAREAGVPSYVRVAALNDHPLFIAGLADLVREALKMTVAGPD